MTVDNSIRIKLPRAEAERLVYAIRSVVEDSLRNYNYKATRDIETAGMFMQGIAEALGMLDIDKDRYRYMHSLEHK